MNFRSTGPCAASAASRRRTRIASACPIRNVREDGCAAPAGDAKSTVRQILRQLGMRSEAGLKGKRSQFRPFSAKHLRGVIRCIPLPPYQNPLICAPLARLRELLGPAVLLRWPSGLKGDRRKWKHFTLADMTESYLARFNNDCNVGVALGKVSGGLASIDFDEDFYADCFLKANPVLTDTLRTRGKPRMQYLDTLNGPVPRVLKLKIEAESRWGVESRWFPDHHQRRSPKRRAVSIRRRSACGVSQLRPNYLARRRSTASRCYRE